MFSRFSPRGVSSFSGRNSVRNFSSWLQKASRAWAALSSYAVRERRSSASSPLRGGCCQGGASAFGSAPLATKSATSTFNAWASFRAVFGLTWAPPSYPATLRKLTPLTSANSFCVKPCNSRSSRRFGICTHPPICSYRYIVIYEKYTCKSHVSSVGYGHNANGPAGARTPRDPDHEGELHGHREVYRAPSAPIH